MAMNAAEAAVAKGTARQRIKGWKKKDKGVSFQMLRDAYYGTGGFEDGEYLIQHKREKADKYNKRQELAYYLNYTAPCVNSHVDPIFRQEIKRDWKGPGSTLWEQFTENTDNAGTKIQGLAKRAALGAKLFGVNFIVMDNAKEQPETLGQAIDSHVLPYAFIVEPDRVLPEQVKTDRFGRLTQFSYIEPKDRDGVNQADDDYNIRTWTTTGWVLTDKDGKLLEQGEHSLKRVPVTVWPSREMDPAVVFQPSEFAAIVKTNHHLYQLCSWLSEILQNQAFSILIYPSREGTALTIGTDNALGFDGEASHAPAFIAPPADPATMLENQIDRLIQEIYRMANLTLVTGVQKQTSGVSKAWDFERTNQTLSDFAANCQAAEKDLADVFALWVGQALTYTVEYPTDFKIVDVADELANAETAVGLNLGSTFLIEVAKKVLAAYLPGLDTKVFDKVVAEIEAKGTDELMSRIGSYTGKPAESANIGALTGIIKQLLQVDGIDPALKAKAEEALNGSSAA